jgi:hypothetical protein
MLRDLASVSLIFQQGQLTLRTLVAPSAEEVQEQALYPKMSFHTTHH